MPDEMKITAGFLKNYKAIEFSSSPEDSALRAQVEKDEKI